jgi:hypothetical protein
MKYLYLEISQQTRNIIQKNRKTYMLPEHNKWRRLMLTRSSRYISMSVFIADTNGSFEKVKNCKKKVLDYQVMIYFSYKWLPGVERS